MDKILEIYCTILKNHIAQFFAKKCSINPAELNKERFKVKALFTAAILFLKSNPKRRNSSIILNASIWLNNTFAEGNLFSSIIDSSSESLIYLIDTTLETEKGIEFESIDISILYETLLSLETANENKTVNVSIAKNYRNKLGSYYTPKDLAKIVTKKTIDSFFSLNYGIKELSAIKAVELNQSDREILLNDISSISFADFSSGPGIFLIEIIEYFDQFFAKLNLEVDKRTSLIKSITSNIHAFDVDCLALEIAKLLLLLKIQEPSLYHRLSENFVNANFLLHGNFLANEKERQNIFSEGFIYHERLSLQKEKLKKYDIILGNPPWEKIRFEEKRFYALYSPSIPNNHFKATRTNEIKEMELVNINLAEFSTQFKLEIENAKAKLKYNPFFELSNKGELNTYALFTEASVRLRSNRGVIGLVLKSAIVTSQINQRLFKYLCKRNLIIEIYDFINRMKIFNIDSRERFCFLLLGNSKVSNFYVSMNLSDVKEIKTDKTGLQLSYESLNLLNPFTSMLPNFSNEKEADFLIRISHDFPVFKNVFENIKYGRLVHFTNHADFISKKKRDNNIAIYEGKFFNQFDGKYSSFNGLKDDLKYGNKSSSVQLDESRKHLADYFPESRFFISQKKWEQLSKNYDAKFMLAWRSLTSATNTRTCIATVLPFIPASQSVQFLTANENDLLYLVGLFNSVVFDFILKKKLNGIDLTQSVLNQMPVPCHEPISFQIRFSDCNTCVKEHINRLVYSLLKNDIRLIPLFKSLGLTDELALNLSRFELIRNNDLLFIFLYNLNNEELELVISSFAKQYSKDDLAWFKKELKELHLNNTVSPANSTFSSFSPV